MDRISKVFRRANLSCRVVSGGVTRLSTNANESGFEFEIGWEDSVVAVNPKRNRHVLVQVRRPGDDQPVSAHLCGRDEKGCFIATVPSRVSTVEAAFDALKPQEVRDAERSGKQVKRQGEWFFIPVQVEPIHLRFVLRKESLQATPFSKPHVAEELFRVEGVWVEIKVKRQRPKQQPMSLRQRRKLNRWRRTRTERRFIAGAAYVRGDIRHPDHSTLHLDGWHKVAINQEIRPYFWGLRQRFGANACID